MVVRVKLIKGDVIFPTAATVKKHPFVPIQLNKDSSYFLLGSSWSKFLLKSSPSDVLSFFAPTPVQTNYEITELTSFHGSFHAVAPPGTVDLGSADAHKLSIEKSKYLGGMIIIHHHL
ncbi:unnamed protein product [Fraxinus pennsylvanica]|uniref:RED-like N-terminal domain-containing protein n=1 Tax=Fraxinus pennsylvanica TaxID=56036 RepID=A0AAD1ZY95_9LAMI|nr:unnamed protein product [Fraxinus pennsylvanica]